MSADLPEALGAADKALAAAAAAEAAARKARAGARAAVASADAAMVRALRPPKTKRCVFFFFPQKILILGY